VVKVKYENLSNYARDFGGGLFNLASFKDDGTFEYFAEHNEGYDKVYSGESQTTLIGFEINPMSKNLELCFRASGLIGGKGNIIVYTKCNNYSMPFEFRLGN
jgi:hypothetical protein